MATLQNGDKFLVQRTDSQSGISTNYQVSQENLMANLADDDLLLVQRTTSGISTNYCISASDLKADLSAVNGLIRPPVEVLTPLNGAGITEFTQYEPLSSAITAVGEAGTLAKDTDEIQSVADEAPIVSWNIADGSSPSFANTDINFATELAAKGVTDITGINLYLDNVSGYPYTSNLSGFTLNNVDLVAAAQVSLISYNGTPYNSSYGWVSFFNGGGYNQCQGTTTYTCLFQPYPLGTVAKLKVLSVGGRVSLLDQDGAEHFIIGSSGNKILSFPTNTNFSGLSVGDSVQYGETYATLNPSDNPVGNAGNLTNGNLNLSNNSGNYAIYRGTLEIPSTGKWYYECTFNGAAHSRGAGAQFSGFGIAKSDVNITGFADGNSFWIADTGFADRWVGGSSGRIDYAGQLLDGGDVVGLALDRDNNTFEFFVNGSSVQTGPIGYSGAIKPYAFCYSNTQTTIALNFGQNAWAHEPPSGYLGLTEKFVITSIDSAATPPTITVSGGTWDTSNQSQVWSSGADNSTLAYSSTWEKVFDGSDYRAQADGGWSAAVSAGVVATHTLPSSISGTIDIWASKGTTTSGQTGTVVKLLDASDNVVLTWDLTGVPSGSATWQGEKTTSTEITKIRLEGGSGSYASTVLQAIKVNGKLLVDAAEDSQVWSSFGTGNAYSTRTWDQAFNGIIGTSGGESAFANLGQTMTWTPSTPLTVNDSVILYCFNETDGANYGIKLNGSSSFVLPEASSYGTPVSVPAADIGGSLSKIELVNNPSGYGPYLTGVEVDGKLLIDAGVRGLGDRKLSSSVSYEKSLTFADTTQLANMVTPLEMVDANGDVVTPVSDTIANVSNNVLTLASDTNLAYFQPGDEVQTGVQVVSVDAAAPSITVDGGEWLGSDGTNSAVRVASKSLRFNSTDSAYLSRTPSSEGNRKTWTWSGWVKMNPGSISGYNLLWSSTISGTGDQDALYLNFDDRLYLIFNNSDPSGATFNVFITNRQFRDPNAFYHLVLIYDATASSNYVKLYVNGIEETSFYTDNRNNAALSNHQSSFNAVGEHRIGKSHTNDYLNAYLADVHFIDGQAVEPTAFGEFDSNGVWKVKEADISSPNNGTTWSNYITIAEGNTGSNYNTDATNMFDGDTSTYTSLFSGNMVSPYSPTTVVFTPPSAMTVNTGIRVYMAVNRQQKIFVNGNETNASVSAGWNDVSFTGTLTSLSIGPTQLGSSSNINAIEIDGVVLVDGATAYGTNGFNLDFSDSSSDAALGYDAAGSNDWTVNNLTAAGSNWNQSQVWSTYGTFTGTFSQGGNIYNWVGVFNDGEIYDSYGSMYLLSGTGKWTLASPIACNSEVKFYMHTATSFTINEGLSDEVTSASTGYGYHYHTIPFSGIIASIKVNTAQTYLIRIFVDGKALIDTGILDPEAANVDSLVDTPTNYGDDTGLGGEVRGSYATLSPLSKGTNITLSNGNLHWTAPASPTAWESKYAFSTIGVTSGKWYAEVLVDQWYSSEMYIGIMGDVASTFSNASLGYQSQGWGYYSNGNIYHSASIIDSTPETFRTGDIIGIALDVDNKTVAFYKNGVQQGSVASITSDMTWVFAANCYGAGDQIWNFGQRAFVYAAPSGYKVLCDTNLPEATIKDGSKHFDIVKYEGNSGTNVISGFNFSPDLVWIKGLNSYSHCLYDTVRGAGKRIATDGPWVEDDYNLLNAFNSDGFTLGTTASGGVYAQNATGDEGVAWCWNAGENSNKTYTVTVVSDNGNKYRFDGHGTSGVTLDLQEGSTYIFDQSDSSNSGHPIRFGTSVNGTDYTTGVTHVGTPGTAGAKTTLVVESGAPGLFYSCGVHSGMGGQINTNSTAGATVLSGSLNSAAYDQSQNWSSIVTVSNNIDPNYPVTDAFDGSLSTLIGANPGGTVTFNFGTIFSSTPVALEVYSGTSRQISVDGTLKGTAPAGLGWVDCGTLSFAEIAAGPAHNGGGAIYAIKVNGRILVDSGVSVAAVPAISSVVKANPEAGFSIVSYTSNGNNGDGVGHGLNAKPSIVIQKKITGTSEWLVQTDAVDGSDDYLLLNTLGTKVDGGSLSGTNSSTFASWNVGGDMIAYCFAPVKGYSAIGSYTGNGSADGPFVHTGFKPAWIMIKSTDGSEHWRIVDSTRDPINPANSELYANNNSGENPSDLLDFLSNGFKIRVNYSGSNSSGHKYIYMAFAENPVAQDAQTVTTGDTQVTLDPLAAIATEIVETNGTTMYLNSATGPWRTGLSIEGSQVNAAPPGPNEVTFTSMNDGSTPVSMIDATLSTRTWTLESGASATGPWTLIDSYVDFDATDSQNGATPWTSTKPTLQPNSFYRVKVSYDSTNADSVESVYSTFKTGDA